jgi:type I restriction enzyme S subunit
MLEKIADSSQEEKFKQTEIGLIPEDWDVVRLGEVIKEVISGDWGFGEIEGRESENGIVECRIIRGTDFPNLEKGIYRGVPIRFIKKPSFEKRALKEGDLLVEISGGSKDQPTGRIFYILSSLFEKSDKPLLFTNFVKLLRTNRGLVYPEYVYRYWSYIYSIGRTRIYEKRTTNIRNFKYKDFLSNECLILPPLPEQQKIVKVLSTIQRAIDHQDKIIEAVRKLKKSLLHKLFTEGLNGEEQKETKIGRVPNCWDVMRLGNVVDFTKKPGTLNLSDFKKIPFIPMEMIPIEKLYINDHLLKSSKEITSGVYCEKGDILLAKITPSFENGKQGIIENIPYDFAFATTEVYPLKPRNNLLDKLFLFYFLIKSDVREAIAGKMQGTTGRKRVPKEAVENTLIPLPSLSEQQQIAHILSTVDKKIEIEERRKTTLKELFKTMLHKLMSGEIRLKDVNI